MKSFKVCLLCSVALLTIANAIISLELSAGEIRANSHAAPHQGVLSEIERCSVGHAEIKIDGNTMQLWLLDGGNATTRSVPSADERIPLSIFGPDQVRFEMVLNADPMKLAGEKVGHCSRFTGVSENLQNLPSFHAFGWLRFKGQIRPLRLAFPHGFFAESDHESKCGHDHGHGEECGHENDGPAGDAAGKTK